MIAREAVLPALIIVFLTTAYSTINGFLVIYADQIKVGNIGLFFTVYSLVLLVSRPIIGKLTEKCSLSFIVFPSLICFGVAMYLVSIAESLTMFIIAAVISAFGYGALQPLIQALCLKSVSVQNRGAASSTSYMGTNLGYLIGPMIGGIIIQHFGYSVMFRSTIICLVCAGIVYMVYQRKEKMI